MAIEYTLSTSFQDEIFLSSYLLEENSNSTRRDTENADTFKCDGVVISKGIESPLGRDLLAEKYNVHVSQIVAFRLDKFDRYEAGLSTMIQFMLFFIEKGKKGTHGCVPLDSHREGGMCAVTTIDVNASGILLGHSVMLDSIAHQVVLHNVDQRASRRMSQPSKTSSRFHAIQQSATHANRIGKSSTLWHRSATTESRASARLERKRFLEPSNRIEPKGLREVRSREPK